jgi:hypothetical protein
LHFPLRLTEAAVMEVVLAVGLEGTVVVSVVTGAAREVIAVISEVTAVVSVRAFTVTVIMVGAIMVGVISGDIMTTDPPMMILLSIAIHIMATIPRMD